MSKLSREERERQAAEDKAASAARRGALLTEAHGRGAVVKNGRTVASTFLRAEQCDLWVYENMVVLHLTTAGATNQNPAVSLGWSKITGAGVRRDGDTTELRIQYAADDGATLTWIIRSKKNGEALIESARHISFALPGRFLEA